MFMCFNRSLNIYVKHTNHIMIILHYIQVIMEKIMICS